MNTILFAAVVPDNAQDWHQFKTNLAAKLKPSASHIVQLAETVWLLIDGYAPSALAWLIAYAESAGIRYAIAEIDGVPRWLPGGIDPKTILA